MPVIKMAILLKRIGNVEGFVKVRVIKSLQVFVMALPSTLDGMLHLFDCFFCSQELAYLHILLITLLFILLVPLITMAMLLIPSVYYLVESTSYLFNIMKNDGIGFWGGLVTIVLISFDILRFSRF